MAMPNVWSSPVIKAGQDVTLTLDGNDYACTLGGVSFRVPMEDLAKRFVVDAGEVCAETGSWEVKHEGRLAAFPDIAHALRSRAVRLGISGWLDWDYQLDDLIETSMGRIGAVISWEMGLGKGRLAAALCVMGGMRHNLITVDASLVPEIVEELSGLPIPAESWQVIGSPSDLANLKSINVISYQRLRQPISDKHQRRTYARMLRRRIGVMVSDEGDLIKHSNTWQSRAMREIPRIVDLPRYRAMLAPHIKRRLAVEPDVARFVKIPAHKSIVTTLDFDDEHLHHYLTVTEDFIDWYRNAKAGCKQVNLVAILAKLQAVRFACNYPQRPSELGSHSKLTVKQAHTIKRLEELAAGGHKTLVFADSPGYLELLGSELDRRDIGNIVFHGEIPIGKRTKEFKERFRRGDCPVMLASFGVTRRGHNIPEADRVILTNRLWSSREEAQSVSRLLRPQQTREVLVERIHIRGSIRKCAPTSPMRPAQGWITALPKWRMPLTSTWKPCLGGSASRSRN